MTRPETWPVARLQLCDGKLQCRIIFASNARLNTVPLIDPKWGHVKLVYEMSHLRMQFTGISHQAMENDERCIYVIQIEALNKICVEYTAACSIFT